MEIKVIKAKHQLALVQTLKTKTKKERKKKTILLLRIN